MKKTIFIILLIFSFFIIKNPNVKGTNDKIVGPDIIYKQTTSVLLMNDIINLYSYNGDSVNLLSDQYTGNGDVVGVYEFVISAGGQTETKYIEVKSVIHSKIVAVSKSGNNYTIHIQKNNKLNDSDIVKILERIGLYQVLSNDQVLKLSDTYSENYNSPGLYVFEFNIVNANGNSNVYSTKIIVQRDNKINISGDPISMGSSISFKSVLIYSAITFVVVFIIIKRRRR